MPITELPHKKLPTPAERLAALTARYNADMSDYWRRGFPWVVFLTGVAAALSNFMAPFLFVGASLAGWPFVALVWVLIVVPVHFLVRPRRPSLRDADDIRAVSALVRGIRRRADEAAIREIHRD